MTTKAEYRTWSIGDVPDDAMMNEQIRDNGNAIWVGTDAGDMDYYISSNEKARIPIGSEGQFLRSISGVPTWSESTVVRFSAAKTNASWNNKATLATSTTTLNAHTFNTDIPTNAKALMVNFSYKANNSTGFFYLEDGAGNIDIGIQNTMVYFAPSDLVFGSGILFLDGSGNFKVQLTQGTIKNLTINVIGYFL